MKPGTCKHCGKPMQKRARNQRYHSTCRVFVDARRNQKSSRAYVQGTDKHHTGESTLTKFEKAYGVRYSFWVKPQTAPNDLFEKKRYSA